MLPSEKEKKFKTLQVAFTKTISNKLFFNSDRYWCTLHVSITPKRPIFFYLHSGSTGIVAFMMNLSKFAKAPLKVDGNEK